MCRRYKHSEKGLSLAEALVTMGLLCIFIVPTLSMLRQSSVNYSHAYTGYKMDLILGSLILDVEKCAKTHEIENIIIDFSDYADNEQFGIESIYEFEIIIEEFQSNQARVIRYPFNSDLDIQPASVNQTGYFSGLITAAIKDARTGLIKVKTLPY